MFVVCRAACFAQTRQATKGDGLSHFVMGHFEVSMLAKRILPCLDVTGGRVVKGTRFVNLRDAARFQICMTMAERDGVLGR